MIKCKTQLILTIASFVLMGCSSSLDNQLDEWIAHEKKVAKSSTEKISKSKEFIPQIYNHANGIDPFGVQKLTAALKRDTSSSASSQLVNPELKREKEPLESTSLDNLHFVGVIFDKTEYKALIKNEKVIYTLKKGSHLGVNFGLIKEINEKEIKLREIIQDASGEWTEKNTSMVIQEYQRNK